MIVASAKFSYSTRASHCLMSIENFWRSRGIIRQCQSFLLENRSSVCDYLHCICKNCTWSVHLAWSTVNSDTTEYWNVLGFLQCRILRYVYYSIATTALQPDFSARAEAHSVNVSSAVKLRREHLVSSSVMVAGKDLMLIRHWQKWRNMSSFSFRCYIWSPVLAF